MSAGAGVAGRELVRTYEGLGPWGGRVTVTAVGMSGRTSGLLGPGRMFEVTATWTGPAMALDSSPAAERDAIAYRQDSHWTADHELAQAIARHAADALRAPRVPDLAATARILER